MPNAPMMEHSVTPSLRVHPTRDAETDAPILLYTSRHASLDAIERLFRRFERLVRDIPASYGPWKAILHIPPGVIDVERLAELCWGTPGEPTGPHVALEIDARLIPPLSCVRTKHRTVPELARAFRVVLGAIAEQADDLPYALSLFRRMTRRDPAYRSIWVEGDSIVVRDRAGATRSMTRAEFLAAFRTILARYS